MRLFEEREIMEAYKFATAGGQALHLFNDAGIYPGAPAVFKRSRQAAHLFDQNTERLITTAKWLGVKKSRISHKGTPQQHIDLCGRPLKRAIKICREDE
jgi:hypothetical protein